MARACLGSVSSQPRGCGRHERVAILPPSSAPLRIGFASDLHLGPTTPDALLVAAFAILARAKLDVLALGGDYVFLDATPDKARRLAELVASVGAPVTVAVMGNHDLWTDHPLLEAALAEVGAHVVVNDAVRLSHGSAGVAIVGIDDPWTGMPDPDAAFARAAGADTIIALSHSPDGVPMLAGRGVGLVLCGHTHGGHIALPGHRPIVVPGIEGRRYAHGRHELSDGAVLLVSRGLGGIELPIRTYAPPDVIIVDIE